MALVIPMRRRLPNPPAVFVGRQREIEQLRMSAQRAPVTFIVGPDGWGKSALIQHTFKQPSLLWKGPIVVVGVHPDDPLDDALVMAYQVLTPDPEMPVPQPRDALLDALLDAAERHDAMVIFEDLAHPFAAHPGVLATLRALAGHAERSRWILTCTRAPHLPDLAEQMIAVPPLDPSDARALAKQCGAKDIALERIIADAGGSPLAIRQGAMQADTLEGVARISPGAHELLRVLAQVRQPLSVQALEKVGVIVPADAELSALEDAGWLQQDGDARKQLPEVLRQAMAAVVADADRASTQERLAIGLAELDDDDAQLEAFDAALQANLTVQAAQWITARGDDWISKGRAGRVWRQLRSYVDKAQGDLDATGDLATWAFRTACAAGSIESLEWVTSQPTPHPSSPSLPYWLEANVLRGFYEDVVDATESSRTETSMTAACLLRRARALTAMGRLQEATEVLENLVIEDEATACVRDAHLSKTLMLLGDYTQATALSRGIQSRMDRLPQTARMAVDFERALVELTLGNRAMSRPFEVPTGMTVRRDRATLMEAVHALLGSKLGRVEELLEPLDALASPFDQSWRYLIDGVLQALRGRELEARTALTAGLEEARTHDIRTLYPWIVVLREAIEGLLDTQWPAVSDDAPPNAMPLVDAMKAISRYARAINLRPDAQDAWPPEPAHPQRAGRESPATTLTELAWTRIHFMRGELEQSDLFCTTALRRAAQSGWALLEQLGWMARLPLVVALGHQDAVETTLRTLARMSELDDEHVIQDWVRLWRAIASSVPDVATLFGIARNGRLPARPVARALVGPAHPLPGYRRACVAAAQSSWTYTSLRIIRQHNDDYRPCWVIDLVRQRLTSPTSEELDIARSKLGLRILGAVAASEHGIDKEELALSVWELPAYDPRRDDNRLHVALNRLRTLMGKLPGADELLQTGPQGYFLGAPQPIAILLPIEPGTPT